MSTSFDVPALRQFLAERVDAAFLDGDATFTQFAGGASNLTGQLTVGDRTVVVRRAPPGKKAATAHDMVREARVMTAVRPHFPRVPKVLAVCDDAAVLGTRFFVMEHLPGPVPGRRLPGEWTPEATRTLCTRLVDLHADLHAIDLDATGLGTLGKPQGYVERQITGWTRRFRDARTPDVPDCEDIIAWLEARMPGEVGAALIHNDFKFDNVILDAGDPTQIVGVIDWEMATVGDPLMDLGASLAYWVQADDPKPMQQMRTLPTNAPGMLTRQEVVERYAARSGREIADWTWYYVYGLFRLAGIVQQIYLRYTLGQTKNPRFATFGLMVFVLAGKAQQVIASTK